MEFLGGRGGGAGPLPSSGGMTVVFGMENADACTCGGWPALLLNTASLIGGR